MYMVFWQLELYDMQSSSQLTTTTKIHLFIGRMSFLSAKQQCHSIEGPEMHHKLPYKCRQTASCLLCDVPANK